MGTEFRVEPYNKDVKASQSRVIRRESKARSHHETIFDLSFEGISLYGSKRLEGVDAETGLNVSYYNRERRTITFRGTEGKAWGEIVKAPRRKGKALHFIAVQSNEGGLNDEKIRVTGSVNDLKAVAIVNSVDIYIPRSWKALTKIKSQIIWLTV